jgi:hypothetical protein
MLGGHARASASDAEYDKGVEWYYKAWEAALKLIGLFKHLFVFFIY